MKEARSTGEIRVRACEDRVSAVNPPASAIPHYHAPLPYPFCITGATMTRWPRILLLLPLLQKVRRLKTSLHLIGAVPEGGARKHTVFVDDAAEARAFRPEAYFGTPVELLGRTHNRPRESQLLDESLPAASGRAASKALKKTEKWVGELGMGTR